MVSKGSIQMGLYQGVYSVKELGGYRVSEDLSVAVSVDELDSPITHSDEAEGSRGSTLP